MQLKQLLALGVFSSYFLVILWLFSFLIHSFRSGGGGATRKSGSKPKIATFIGLAVASFAHTWFYMFKYMSWSFTTYESQLLQTASSVRIDRVSGWLVDTSLFEQAWAAVCFGSMNWWWSEQLCLFTVGAWTVFLFTEGHRHQIKHLWAYMLLGQLVAISVASNLFYLALLLSKPTAKARDSVTVPPILWLSVFISLATIATSPFTTERTFLPNLLVMHALLVIPLISSPKPARYSLNLGSFYFLIFLASIPIRSRTLLAALNSLDIHQQSPYGLFRAAWATLHSHPAQSSIGWDVVWTTISFVLWNVLDPGPSTSNKWLTVPYLLVATPFTSIGVTAPYVLRPRGRQLAQGSKEE